MQQSISPQKKLKSPAYDGVNIKTSITCTNVPESLFDATTAKKHFSKFGRVQKIRLFPKRHMCIIEYDQPLSVQRAVLNAGAYDGFMFDVTRTKPRVRRKSKKEDDPDWLPDSDVEKELMTMGGAPTYRLTRQKPMDLETNVDVAKNKTVHKISKSSSPRKNIIKEKKLSQTLSDLDSSPSMSVMQNSMSTTEAAIELHQLRTKVALTPDEQWRLLDARDKILRSWGGAGSRVKIGGATIGTCPDMCPEKERLHRQAEYQVMTLETVRDSDGQLEPWRAVKQYSRSSADQEIPMCYELRPASVLMRTCTYLLHEIADTTRQVTLADWFHFMWDRLRGIRKDITQQALCCPESIELVEMCARFHAHCAARLADLEHTQFDQKLNTDNLTKCLQTLKHMYTDVTPDQKPREAEFRGYIALLNLGDANFWWEIKQLDRGIQKSEEITFAIKIFNTLDNNNYVKFFRLVREKASYLQACILLRYFNDVRARALARIVKAFAPRGGSKYPAQDLMSALSFESIDHMKSFITHYGLHFGKTDESEFTVILDRNQFIEDSNPYPVSRAKNLIETKRQSTVGEVIAGGQLRNHDCNNHKLYTSFDKNGTLRPEAIIAEDQGYNTINDSNKDKQALKAELGRLSHNLKNTESIKKSLYSKDLSNKSEHKLDKQFSEVTPVNEAPKLFSFKPAIPIAPAQAIKDSPKVSFSSQSHVFSFSKPQESTGLSLATGNTNIFKSVKVQKSLDAQNKIFGETNQIDQGSVNSGLFNKPIAENKNLFSNSQSTIWSNRNKDTTNDKNIFSQYKDVLDSKTDTTFTAGNIFSRPLIPSNEAKLAGNIFNAPNKPVFSVFTKSDNNENKTKLFSPNGDVQHSNLSPSSLFKSVSSAKGPETNKHSIFQSKDASSSVANNIFNSVQMQQKADVYEFQDSNDTDLHRINEAKRKEDERKEQLKRQEEMRIKQDMQKKKEEEIKRLEEKRKREEERKQAELQKKLEEERRAEQKRKAEEEKKYKEKVEKESEKITVELMNEVCDEILNDVIKNEMERFNNLMSYASIKIEEILMEVCSEICYSEMKAEKIWTEKLMKKWFYLWRKRFIRNKRRRDLLDDTPVWLPDDDPIVTATRFRRSVEQSALQNMNAIHKGYKFTGEPKSLPAPKPFDIMEIIRSPLLKRMKQICYPYDKCFFWKVTLVSPGEAKWLYRRINVQKWLLEGFSNKKENDISKSLLQVQRQSWNNLMNFAISVSLISDDSNYDKTEAVEGTNGMLFYTVEDDPNFIDTIKDTLSHKYPYQCIPVAIVMPKACIDSIYKSIEQHLISLVNSKTILAYRILLVDPVNLSDSLNLSTKSALKWIARKYPKNPPLEIDCLKSLCQKYLGNEIWHSLKSLPDSRMTSIHKDFRKLIECYNKSVEKLTEIITNEDLFNYPTFPLEFNSYLDDTSLYPKPFEFVTSNIKSLENIYSVKDVMEKLKLPEPKLKFHPVNVITMQEQIRSYCKQIGWFENSDQVVCKVISVFPNEFSNSNLSSAADFSQYLEQYDLTDILNIVVYEKINSLNNLNNLFVVYDKSEIEEYRNYNWLFDSDILRSIKHKVVEYEDDIDLYIESKRRKLAIDSMEYLILEDKDQTLVEESIKVTNENISKYSDCKVAVDELEAKIEEERKKALELENLLKIALLRD